MGWMDDEDETRARVSGLIAFEPHDNIDVCRDDDWNDDDWNDDDDDAGRLARWGDVETRARWGTIGVGGRGAQQSPWRRRRARGGVGAGARDRAGEREEGGQD